MIVESSTKLTATVIGRALGCDEASSAFATALLTLGEVGFADAAGAASAIASS